MAGFVGGDPGVVAEAGRGLTGLGRELAEVAAATGSQARRAADAAGHEALAAALEGWAASWGCGLSVLAAQVVAVAILARVGGGDLARTEGASR